MVRLGDICIQITDGSHNPPMGVEQSNYLMLSSKNIDDDHITFNDPRYLSQEDFEAENKRTNIKPNDLLITIVGTIGRVAIVPNSLTEFCVQRSVAVLKPKPEMVYNRFLMYYLQNMRPYLEQESRGVAQKGIYLKQLSNLSIILPPLDEQRKIAAVLDKVSDLIAKRRQQLDKLDELIKARFVEMFGKRFPECTLLSLCNIIDYRGKTPQKVDFGLPFITAKNIRMHRMVLEPKEYISKETYDKVMVRGFPKEGDVVFTTEAPLGNVCRIPHFDTEFYVGQRIVTLQTTALHPAYLEYALDTEEFKKKIAEKSSGSTVAGIRVRLLEQLTIPVPPLDLQNQFAAFVEQTEKTKTTISRSLEKLETLKKALMQEYFG